MKNVQVIDGADNCTYSIFGLSDDKFELIFPAGGQDIEFIEDVISRIGIDRTSEVLDEAWKHPVPKHLVNGIHGTLFYELEGKKKFYPTKRESEMIVVLD